jgi:Uma2 family endonuclease
MDTFGQIPALQAGDRLTRPEFERRYTAMPHLKKAELIEGVVYIPSWYGQADFASSRLDIIAFLGRYHIATSGTEGSANGTLRLDWENEPQPDAILRILPQYGGASREDGEFVGGAPELIAEVTTSNTSYALYDKLRAYQRNGVREYLVWRVWDEAIDWFVFRNGRFERLALTDAGHYHSEVFPGLWLDPAALLRGDGAQVLQQGIASPEHAAFVTWLQAASGGGASK